MSRHHYNIRLNQDTCTACRIVSDALIGNLLNIHRQLYLTCTALTSRWHQDNRSSSNTPISNRNKSIILQPKNSRKYKKKKQASKRYLGEHHHHHHHHRHHHPAYRALTWTAVGWSGAVGRLPCAWSRQAAYGCHAQQSPSAWQSHHSVDDKHTAVIISQ